jgi:arylsulfatase A-like enzyme
LSGKTARKAIETLQHIKDKPFFLAVGFVKPHLPFAAPKKYWDLYKREDIKLSDTPLRPKGVPDNAYLWTELRDYQNLGDQPEISEAMAKELVHGYYACTSFVDAQIGLVVDELDRLGLRDDTIIVLWGDHGFHLGDQGIWGKHTNFEYAVRAPLIVHAPGQKTVGQSTDALVEFVDIYPTLAELCGFELPAHLDGISFAPLLKNPERPWKQAAFSQYRHFYKSQKSVMGCSMRTDSFRYIEWRDRGRSDRVVARELYDFSTGTSETGNVADQPAYAGTLKRMASMMEGGWRGALPV